MEEDVVGRHNTRVCRHFQFVLALNGVNVRFNWTVAHSIGNPSSAGKPHATSSALRALSLPRGGRFSRALAALASWLLLRKLLLQIASLDAVHV